MCNPNKFQRIDSYIALKHPWITRDKEQTIIPSSYFEKLAFDEKKRQFKRVSYLI